MSAPDRWALAIMHYSPVALGIAVAVWCIVDLILWVLPPW